MNDWERSLFQGIGISRISKIVPQIPDITPSPVKGSILSIMLPSLHYIAIVATLDEALMEYIEIHDIPWPSRTKRDLFNRINVVSGVVPNINAPNFRDLLGTATNGGTIRDSCIETTPIGKGGAYEFEYTALAVKENKNCL